MDKIEKLKFFFQDKGYDLRKAKGFERDVDVFIKALNKHDSLCALELYYDLSIPILGGDVLYLNDDRMIGYTGDNWYCDPLEGESFKHFLNRSIEVSRNYIIDYNHAFLEASSILFDLVPDYPEYNLYTSKK